MVTNDTCLDSSSSMTACQHRHSASTTLQSLSHSCDMLCLKYSSTRTHTKSAEKQQMEAMPEATFNSAGHPNERCYSTHTRQGDVAIRTCCICDVKRLLAAEASERQDGSAHNKRSRVQAKHGTGLRPRARHLHIRAAPEIGQQKGGRPSGWHRVHCAGGARVLNRVWSHAGNAGLRRLSRGGT